VEMTTRTWRARPRRPQYENAQDQKRSRRYSGSLPVPPHPVCAALPSVGPSNIRDCLHLPQIQPDCCLPTLHPRRPQLNGPHLRQQHRLQPLQRLSDRSQGNNRHRLPLNTISLTRRTCLAPSSGEPTGKNLSRLADLEVRLGPKAHRKGRAAAIC
jgi:hypothetical protein